MTLALGMLACEQPETSSPHPRTSEPRPHGTFRMAQDSPGSLDPALLDDVYESTIVNQIFEGLLAFDLHLNTIPSIARSWTISSDGLEYVFELEPQARFHDGTFVRAEDVVYSFTRVFDLPEAETILAREYLGHIAGCETYAAGEAESILGLEAVDSLTVRIRLEEPFGSFLAVLASDPARIVPRHYVETVGPEAFGRRPVGSGPFRLAEWDEGRRLVLVAFEDHHPRRALLDSLVFDFPAANARDVAARQFLDGRLSASVIPDGRLPEFERAPNARILKRQELSLSFLGFNRRYPPFENREVRRAFAMAIDRDALVREEGTSRVAPHGILPPGMPGYTPESKLLPHDPAKARRLLTAAGHPEGRGLPEIVLTTASQTDETRRMLQRIVEQAAAVGFRVRIEALSWLEFSRRLTAQDLQCFNVTWVADIPDPDSFLYPIGHRDGAANFASYENAEVDRLLDSGRTSRSEAERMRLYRKIERMILEDAPIVPLFHPMSAIAVQASIRGMQVTPMGVGNIAMERVWIADPKETLRKESAS